MASLVSIREMLTWASQWLALTWTGAWLLKGDFYCLPGVGGGSLGSSGRAVGGLVMLLGSERRCWSFG